jgi:competence protein ComEA
VAFGVGVLRAHSDGGVELVRGDGQVQGARDAARGEDAAEADSRPRVESLPSSVVVHVDGAVANPGVYELRAATPRARDAIEAAGGLTEDADTTGLNLAQAVADGTKVHVPHAGEAAVQTTQPSTGGGGTAGPVNINTAGADELKALPGVGDATAASIIREREEHGPFTSPEDIMRVSGIGEKKFEKIRDGICV